ncbi:hypothetical protein X801_08293 [Opisthorchis viverrini]|uniref:Uncharacterized protein n=1 Tax=Opisthorchis viverrini TaxID=6198 RepID=A0A1S8WN75_OPIVI|nr:hypothetical protein X801_08293 [Opisthorchis viverrini]
MSNALFIAIDATKSKLKRFCILWRLTTLLIFYPLVYCARRQCFNLEQELSYCSQKLKVKMPVNQLAGYSFGYGSLNDTEYMCR